MHACTFGAARRDQRPRDRILGIGFHQPDIARRTLRRRHRERDVLPIAGPVEIGLIVRPRRRDAMRRAFADQVDQVNTVTDIAVDRAR
jgi:hypothetical protein